MQYIAITNAALIQSTKQKTTVVAGALTVDYVKSKECAVQMRYILLNRRLIRPIPMRPMLKIVSMPGS
jgi:hypothetical protein